MTGQEFNQGEELLNDDKLVCNYLLGSLIHTLRQRILLAFLFDAMTEKGGVLSLWCQKKKKKQTEYTVHTQTDIIRRHKDKHDHSTRTTKRCQYDVISD